MPQNTQNPGVHRPVVIVDNDIETSDLLSQELVDSGMAAIVAHSLDQAIERIKQVQPTVMVCAAELPDGHARDLFRLLQESDFAKDLAIIMTVPSGTFRYRELSRLKIEAVFEKPLYSDGVIGLCHYLKTPLTQRLTYDGKNNRRHERLDVKIDLEWNEQGRSELRVTQLKNLSLGGTYISGPHIPSEKCLIDVGIHYMRGSWKRLQVQGQVRWTAPPDIGFGVQFIDLNDHQREELGYLVNEIKTKSHILRI